MRASDGGLGEFFLSRGGPGQDLKAGRGSQPSEYPGEGALSRGKTWSTCSKQSGEKGARSQRERTEGQGPDGRGGPQGATQAEPEKKAQNCISVWDAGQSSSLGAGPGRGTGDLAEVTYPHQGSLSTPRH